MSKHTRQKRWTRKLTVANLRKVNFMALDLSRLGNGVPDMMLFKPSIGFYTLLEVRSRRRRRTIRQTKFQKAWQAKYLSACNRIHHMQMQILKPEDETLRL